MPRLLQGLIVFAAFLIFYFNSNAAYAKLRTEELGNTEKEKIAQHVKKVKDNPDDGFIAFAESQELIKINHVKAFDALGELYATGTETVKAKIIKAIGQQRDKGVIDDPNYYWRLLSQGLDNTSGVVSGEVITSLSLLESVEFFSKLVEKLKAKDISKTLIDNAIKVFCRFDSAPSGAPVVSTETIGLRVEAAKSLPASHAKNRRCLLDALSEYLGEEFAGLEQLEKWWGENRDKSILQIEIEAKRRIIAENEREKKRAEKNRLKAVSEQTKYLENLLAANREKAVAEFLKELSDPGAQPEVLVFAIASLGRLKAKDGFDPIMRHLESGDVQVRIAAIKALGEMGNLKALPEIARKVSAESLSEKLAAIDTVAKLGGEQAAQVLLKVLDAEKDLSARRAAVRGLGEVGLPVAIVPLVEIVAIVSEGKLEKLRDTVTNDFLKDVANALGSILVSGRECDDAHRELAVDYMLAMLAVANDQVKYAAIKNLGNVGAGKSVSVLVEELNKNPVSGIRAAAGRALGKMHNAGPEVEKALLANVKDKVKEVAQACMWSLRSIACLNGSGPPADFALLLKWSSELLEKGAHETVRSLLKNLPDESEAQLTDKESKDRLYELKGRLAEAHMGVGDFKAAQVELEKVVPHFKEPAERVLKYHEMLARSYGAQEQVSKAIDEYLRLIKMVEPAQAGGYWKEGLSLIIKLGNGQEKLKRIEAALLLNPPQEIKEQLENLKQKTSPKPPEEPKTP